MAIQLPGANTVAEESSLSSWAGPYVTQMLGRGAAGSSMPYVAYEGPLTAGPSALQTQAYQGLGALQVPDTQAMAYSPTSFTSGDYAQQYMSPYLSAALDPQIAEARRQAQISQQQLQSQYGRAGAYGGSRQGVAEAELQRGLLDRLATITGTGYQQAFEQAQKQFNTEEDRRREAAQGAQDFGLRALAAQQLGGEQQRAIEQAGISADLAQFEQERDYPLRMTQYMQSLLQGLPLETQTYSYYEPSGLQSLTSNLGAAGTIFDLLSRYFPGSSAQTTPTGTLPAAQTTYDPNTGGPVS